MKRWLLLLASPLLFCSCNKAPSVETPELERYAKLYAHLLMAAEQYKTADSAVTLESYRSRVSSLLHQAGTSEGALRDFTERLWNSPERVNEFLDLVNKELERARTGTLNR